MREGDIIAIEPGWRVSKHVHHVVASIIAPFGKPIEERPPVPSAEERIAERLRKKEAKSARRAEARKAFEIEESVEELIRSERMKDSA